MPPKTAGQKAANSDEKRIKLPKSYISRPAENSVKGCRKVYVEKEVLTGLEISNGGFVKLNGDSGSVIATLHYDQQVEVPELNTLLISDTLRNLGGFLLGDRLEIKKLTKQPAYAQDVTVRIVSDDIKVDKILDSVGIISPGLIVDNKLEILAINNDVESQLSNLSLNGGTSTDETNTFLFKKGIKITSVIEPLSTPDLYGNVGGLSKEIDTLKSVVELPLNNPTLFSDFGISPPRGILLHGPPGTGKTMLLRCIAQSSRAHILSVNGPSIVSKYLGETEEAIRDIFQEAKRYQPSIIFMDEIDSLAPNRNSDDSGEVESRVVATLLTMMDGLGSSGKVVVVGATNRPNTVDPALRRPGRFDQEIEIGIPDVEARFDILTKQFAKMKKSKVTLDELNLIASKTHGYVGADLTGLCRESVMKAIKRGLDSNISQDDIFITLEDIEQALPEITPSAMREIFLEMPKVYWSDIGGQEELKKKLVEVVQLPLEAANTFSNLGVSAPKGVLLYGPPGCSKTLTAKALATESGLNFLAVKGPEIFNKYVGESEKTIREIFRKARAASPSIIFFDEIDAISGDRDDATTSASSHVLTSLLNEIDGVEELKGVVIVAATNRPTEIDPALLRPGRLDRHIYVAPPDYEARLQILVNRSKKFNLDNNSVDLSQIAKATEGCSGAEVALLCQEAGLAAVMEDKQANKVEKRHFDHALGSITKGITSDMLNYYKEFASRSGIVIE